MKKRNKYMFLILGLVLIAILGTVYISKNTSFNKVVLNKINETEITSIEITRSSLLEPSDIKETIVTDTNEIKDILNDFSQIKLKKSNNNHYSNNYHYSLALVQDKHIRRFVIWIYDKKSIEIYDDNKTKKHSNSYKITNEYNSESLENLFK